jgi:hypothetical protein
MLTRFGLLVLLIGPISALAVQETVTYPELTGFKSVTYKSEFFGYQSGVNRDFTNYGTSFADPVDHEPGWKIPHEEPDFNGDGVADKCTYEPKTGAVSIRLGADKGEFGKAIVTRLPGGFSGGALLAADFNGDGYCDIALYGSTAYGFYFLFGRGDGTFGPTRAEGETSAAPSSSNCPASGTQPAGTDQGNCA